MNVIEETIEATLDSNGQLRLSQQPQLPPGPVRVTIRVAAAVGPQRGLADVIRENAADQRPRGFPGRLAVDLRAEDDARLAEDAERDRDRECFTTSGIYNDRCRDSLNGGETRECG